MLSNPHLQFLERFLNVTVNRHAIVTRNMANIDTPGYRTQDLDFRSELERATATPGQIQLSSVVRPVPGLLERPDGNNVNLDRESLLLAETQMQYRLGIQFVRTEIHRLLNAINEGRNA